MFLKRAAVFLFFISSLAHAQVTKIDPLISLFAKQASTKGGSFTSKAMSLNEAGEPTIDCFVVVYNPAKAGMIAQKIRMLGGRVRTKIDTIMTAYIPLSMVQEIASWPDIKYIEAARPMSPKNNIAREATGVDEVAAGTGLGGQTYDGTGVIVGNVDGVLLDWSHPDFLDASGNARVLFYWDASVSGPGVDEIPGSSGIECSAAQINNTLNNITTNDCDDTQGGGTDSHVTHTTGTLAGDDATYAGVAPGAGIIGVNLPTLTSPPSSNGGAFTTDLIDAVNYIFAKATELGLPAVVNLSIGTSIGPHDNTSPLETGLNNLVTANPGRAIVNAAGNENFMSTDPGASTYGGIHAAVSVTSATSKAFNFGVRPGTGADLGSEILIDIWLNSTSTCTVGLAVNDATDTPPSLVTMTPASAGATQTKTATPLGASGTLTLTVNFTDSSNAYNGKRHAVATIVFNSGFTNAQKDDYLFDLIFNGNCTGNAWLWPDATLILDFTKLYGGTDRGYGYTYINGDSNETITIPATASGLIAAASYLDRSSWTDSNGVSHSQTGPFNPSIGVYNGTSDDISVFSSLGPTADGRIKPDITGPGEGVVSSLAANAVNSYNSAVIVNSTHFKDQGTSMSSPHVAGIIALMLQRNHCLTSEQITTLLTSNTTVDSNTGPASGLPNNIWGAGKVNALTTMQAIAAYSGTCGQTGANGTQEDTVGDGGSGCSLSNEGKRDYVFPGVLVAFLALLLIWRRKILCNRID